MLKCDQIAVPQPLWQAVLRGDALAKVELQIMLDGLVLYAHALSPDALPDVPHALVTVREVCAALGDRLTLTLGFDG